MVCIIIIENKNDNKQKMQFHSKLHQNPLNQLLLTLMKHDLSERFGTYIDIRYISMRLVTLKHKTKNTLSQTLCLVYSRPYN